MFDPMPETTPPLDKMETAGSIAVPRLYANSVRVTSTKFDFAMLMALDAPAGFADATMRVPVAVVHTSPAHAMALHAILGKQLATYQEKWGPLPAHVFPDAVKPKKRRRRRAT